MKTREVLMAKNKKEINKEEADYNKYIYKINETLNVLKDESSELEKFSNNLSNKTFDGIKDILKIKSNGFFDINDTLLNLIDLLKGQNKTYRNNLLKDEKQQLDKETDNLRLEQRKLDSLKQKYEKLCDVTQEIDDNSYTGNTELKILVEKLEDVIRNQKKEIDTYELLKYEYGISTITQLDQIIKDKDSTLAYKDEKICKSENEIAELKSSINVKVEDSKEYKELCKINSNLNKAYKNKECESDIKLLAAIEKQKVEIDKVKSINNKLQIELDSFIKPQTLDAKSQRRILDSYTRIQIPKTTIIKSGITELSWIENIQNGIKNYEFDFPWRLIYAFHTSLKVCEINPLTVLTGVSGTGKSELPRLYAHFGGLNFINIPVQPNWDSLDSMMGYYDPIDKKFLSTELFNFLISIREKNNDSVSIVLLDEMNLSHLELYFAEFLSKLEARRGSIKLPEINFKLVSNMDYHLPLENNMLWVGTMNYDETTKNLSDKVIDRGEIITFPRPSKLVDRNCNIVLPKESPLIDKKIYKGWSENYHDELCENALIKYNQNIDRYSKIVGTIENSLSYINRAIGQRVWQATTNYIKYYPLVIDALKNGSDDKIDKAMDIAFEDQFVQKIIPKLKGIETEGYSREKCLNVVMEQLKEFNKGSLERDFKKALNSSYGQFNWVSSEYLQNENNESIEYFKNMN
jgi:hypothetical protein